jgi:glycosyltransferase involved in cell wall biosynthesis
VFCSVLIPTRGRPTHTRKALESLVDTACADGPRWEAILRLDYDDPALTAYLEELSDHRGRVRVVIGSRGRGYTGLERMWNDCARQARGEWLLCFNDDARMLTPEWNRVLAELSQADPEPWCIGPADSTISPYVCAMFPIVSRKVLHTLGHITRHYCVDAYLDRILRSWNSKPYLCTSRLKVYHNCPQDQTRQDTIDAITRDGKRLGPDFEAWVAADAEALRRQP